MITMTVMFARVLCLYFHGYVMLSLFSLVLVLAMMNYLWATFLGQYQHLSHSITESIWLNFKLISPFIEPARSVYN